MKLTQKLSLAVFLYLSLVMAIFALIRVSGIKIGPVIDHNWLVYWLYMEGCIACIMVSVTPFRTLFVDVSCRAWSEKKKGPSYTLRERWSKIPNREGYSGWLEIDAQDSLPRPPASILTGLRTFIRRNNRAAGESTTMMSDPHLLLEEEAQKPMRHGQIYLYDQIEVESSQVSISM